MPFRPDRRRRDDRWLVWKIRIFSVAAVIALAGICLEERWLTGSALVLLVVGMLLRFLPGGGVRPDETGEDDGREA